MSGSGLKLGLGRVTLDIRKHLFPERVMVHWHRMESPSLEVFKNGGDVVMRDVLSEHVGGGLGLDFGVLVVFSNLNNDMFILFCLRNSCTRK